MARPPFDLIAFDGDDTLWHNERSYRDARGQFRRVLAAAGVILTVDEIEEHVNRMEVRNLAYYGYGVSNFTLSLIETALGLVVAIPAVWIYNYLTSRIEYFNVEMDNSSSELVDYFIKKTA